MNNSYIVLVLSVTSTFPQIHQTISSGSVTDYNLWSVSLAGAANAVLGADGYVRGDYGLFAVGVWFVLFNGMLLYYKSRASLARDQLP